MFLRRESTSSSKDSLDSDVLICGMANRYDWGVKTFNFTLRLNPIMFK